MIETPVPDPKPEIEPVTPQLGESVVAAPARGSVRVRLPGDEAFRRLTAAGEIPVGSTVDARAGSVTLTAAAGAGAVQRADFGGAVFSVAQQVAARPVTVLALRGGSFAGCPAARTARRSNRARAARRAGDPHRVVRTLWGSGKGRFRTRGRYSAATVRGTVWQTQDRCDGTLTRVKRGVVDVRDIVRGRTVTVRAGNSYLARRVR